MASRPGFSPDWDEGRFFDRWMLVHFISGVAGGFGAQFFDFSTLGALGLALAVMAAWEMGEELCGVSEAWSNRLLDVAVGGSGTALALFVSAQLTSAGRRIAFAVSFVAAVISSFAGWLAYRRRSAGR